jgi:hypothetical protein
LLRFEETGPITLSRDGDKLVAEMRGNLPALLEVSEELYNHGAGSPALELPTEVFRIRVAYPSNRRNPRTKAHAKAIHASKG